MLVRSRSASCASCWEVAVRSPIDVIWACVAVAAPSALSADALEIAATCCSDCASSARRWAWLRDTSAVALDRKSTRLNSSHGYISYAVFCLKKKKKIELQDSSN